MTEGRRTATFAGLLRFQAVRVTLAEGDPHCCFSVIEYEDGSVETGWSASFDDSDRRYRDLGLLDIGVSISEAAGLSIAGALMVVSGERGDRHG